MDDEKLCCTKCTGRTRRNKQYKLGLIICVVQRLRAMASSGMPKRRLQSIRDKINSRLSFLRRPVPTSLSSTSPSHSLPIPSAPPEASPTHALASGQSGSSPIPAPSGLSEAFPELPPSTRPSAEPSSHSQRPPGGTFDIFVDRTGPPQTAANLAGDIGYKGFRALLDVLDKVGYALPPLKAAAAGLSGVLTVIDVCTTASHRVSVGELMSLMRQNVVQNKADYDEIRHKLEAILSIAQKHRQDGSQRPLDRRVEELATCVVL